MLTTVVASGLRRGVVMVVGRAMGAKVGPTKLPEVMKPERLVLPADYKWKVFAATALERIPPYPPVIPEWEADFERVRDYVEDVNHPRFASEEDVEKAYAKLLGVEPKKIKSKKQEIEEIEDSQDEYDEFGEKIEKKEKKKVYTGETPLNEFVRPDIDYNEERDDPKNRRSLERCKRNRLFLIIQKNHLSGNGYDDHYKGTIEHPWELPGITEWKQGETIRDTAERGIREECGKFIRVYFYGNMPNNVIQTRYSPEKVEKTGLLGERLFLLNAMYCDGPLRLKKNDVRNFAWVKKSELPEYFVSRWRRAFNEFLLD